MASRLVGLTGARRGAAIMSPVSARGMTRGLHASRVTRANEERAGVSNGQVCTCTGTTTEARSTRLQEKQV